MLFLHGTADDYTPIQPCQDYADKIRAAGTPVFTWTVRSEAQRAIADANADAMIFEGFKP